MSAIVNNFDFPVILDDNRNAQTSWENHIRRGSAGGVDLAYPYGSGVRANASGTVWWARGTGSAGWYIQLRIDGRPGWIIEYYHLSGFYNYNGANGYHVNAGDLLGESGGSGYGSMRHYAPHLHVHLVINGTRVNLWNYFTDTAGGGVTPINPGDEDMTPNESAMLKSIYDAIFVGGTSMPDDGRSLGRSHRDHTAYLRDLQTRLKRVEDATFSGGEQMLDDGRSFNATARNLTAYLRILQGKVDAIIAKLNA